MISSCAYVMGPVLSTWPRVSLIRQSFHQQLCSSWSVKHLPDQMSLCSCQSWSRRCGRVQQ